MEIVDLQLSGIPAAWSLCAFTQQSSVAVHQLFLRHSTVTWWATPVEVRSAIERLFRTSRITSSERHEAKLRFDLLRVKWREMYPSQSIRDQAERLLLSHPLKGADALQLAAAVVWAFGTS